MINCVGVFSISVAETYLLSRRASRRALDMDLDDNCQTPADIAALECARLYE